jgi:hypothetical protein
MFAAKSTEGNVEVVFCIQRQQSQSQTAFHGPTEDQNTMEDSTEARLLQGGAAPHQPKGAVPKEDGRRKQVDSLGVQLSLKDATSSKNQEQLTQCEH